MAQRMRHIFFRENLPAAAFRAQREKLRIGAVHRDAEPQREFFLAPGCVERYKVRAIGIHNQRTNAFDEPWPRQEFVA